MAILIFVRWYLIVVLNIFLCVCWHLCIFFGRISVQVFCIYFNWVLLFYIELYKLFICFDINSLSVISFVHIFSSDISIGYLFILWMISFAVWKLFGLIRSNVFIFIFVSFDYTGEADPKNTAMNYVKECSMFFSKNFMIFILYLCI